MIERFKEVTNQLTEKISSRYSLMGFDLGIDSRNALCNYTRPTQDSNNNTQLLE
jgi:hypothetical protein